MGEIHAVLGPTNTGKTHRAIERMLEFETGMLGFPLRLLAREVYERVCSAVDREAVALVTGEEKIVPRHARYFVCTVEAMPMSRPVEFLAVDEIQLAAHEQRGHLFTERLLEARGEKETWFLGSDSMRTVLRELVPTSQVSSFARLSRLTHAGAHNLPRVPPRSAIVAFSLPEVYALAERIRVRRGGAAVVAGALSPRTRNAQVSLFQQGAVDYLVATDAIGMGLNLDVRHVAFASLRKFDGREVRGLDDAETAQIAGRAGRHLRDGTFGTIRPAALSESTVFHVEQHRVVPVRRVFWRASDLDFTSPAALLGSLSVSPSRPRLRQAPLADDQRALQALLAHDPSLAGLRDDEVRRLWEVCKIPDFRKLLFEHHVRFLGDLFEELRTHQGSVRPEWLERRIAPLDDVLGEVEDLTARIAETRLYTYVANQSLGEGSWVQDADTWRARTAALEDRLSDALHEKLVLRFVDSTSKAPVVARARPRPNQARAPASEPPPPRPDHPFAALLPLRRTLRDARLDSTPDLLAGGDDLDWLLAQDTSAIELGSVGEVLLAGRVVGRARRGPELGVPQIKTELALAHKADRAEAERLLERAVHVRIAALFAPLFDDSELPTAELRGVRFALRRGLGLTRTEGLGDLAAAAHTFGPLRIGLRYLALEGRSGGRRRAWIERLLAIAYQRHVPAAGPGAVAAGPRAPRAFWETAGFARVGPLAVPIGLAESILAALRAGGRAEAERLARQAGVAARDVGAWVDDLRDDIAPDELV